MCMEMNFESSLVVLVPEAEGIDLSMAVIEHFPNSPLYGGIFEEVIPHLTIAEIENSEGIISVLQKFQSAALGKLPIRATVNEVLLMDNRSGHWETRDKFVLQSVKYYSS